MSQKSQADQHTLSAVRPAAVAEIAPSGFPVVMITSTSAGIYVADARLTKWEKVEPPEQKG